MFGHLSALRSQMFFYSSIATLVCSGKMLALDHRLVSVVTFVSPKCTGVSFYNEIQDAHWLLCFLFVSVKLIFTSSSENKQNVKCLIE